MPAQEILASFLRAWPLERLRKMELPDYVSVGNDDGYCYWLEFKTAELVGIGGGSAYKFGVFKRNKPKAVPADSIYATDGVHAWVKRYGATAEEAFRTMKAGIIEVAEAAGRGNLAAVAAVNLPPMLLWKTAFLYQDHERPIVAPIFWDAALRFLAFGDPAARRSVAEAHESLLARKPVGQDLFVFGAAEWDRWKGFQGSLSGLIASDGHPWKDELVARLQGGGEAVVWWSKRPTGKALALSQLERLVAERGGFPFYFTRNGVVTHKAHVVDVAVESDYEDKRERWAGALDYEDDFEEYSDETKSARIAFLVDEMLRLEGGLKPSDFEYWNGASPPTQENLQPIVAARIDDGDPEPDEEFAERCVALPARNVIYYGPPGTGKTWFLRSELFERFTRVTSSKDRATWLVEEADRMAWWKVVAASLLALGPASVPAIAEHEFIKAKIATTDQANPCAMIWAMLQQHTFSDCEFVKYSKRAEPPLFRKDADSVWTVDRKALSEIVPEVESFTAKAADYRETGQGLVKNFEFITFHQSMSYEDFIEGIKPTLDDEAGDRSIGYVVKDGIFKQLCRRARLDPSNEYAILIDEINRGNVAGIFGELITLIEENKRAGGSEAISSVLPYSRESFSVPPNLYVLGTMNSADRSVESLDTALRRRFSFVEMPPRPELLGTVEGVDLAKLLTVVNARLEALRDRDHRVGHAYLLGLGSLESLKAAFADRIIPLLQEYFYGDWSRIGLVLGPAFAKPAAARPSWPKAYADEGEALAGESWVITDSATWDAAAFMSIYA